ncbi:MAG: hypothetical protein ACSHX0_06135 [Akkermansiaceae bacterium]
MTNTPSEKNLDTILEELALEECIEGELLATYLERYPQYIEEITDFVHELGRPSPSEHLSLSEPERFQLESRVTKFLQDLSMPSNSILGDLSIQEVKNLTEKLGVKRQVVSALRRGLVKVDTIPEKFCASICDILGCQLEELKLQLGKPQIVAGGLSFKSDDKPKDVDAISFEKTLKNAGYSQEELAQFME